MTDIRSPALLYVKGLLFLLVGCLGAGILLAEHPTWKMAILLAVISWAFCRAYYFAFYVIDHYIDPTFKFAGLLSLVWYLLSRRRAATDNLRSTSSASLLPK